MTQIYEFSVLKDGCKKRRVSQGEWGEKVKTKEIVSGLDGIVVVILPSAAEVGRGE